MKPKVAIRNKLELKGLSHCSVWIEQDGSVTVETKGLVVDVTVDHNSPAHLGMLCSQQNAALKELAQKLNEHLSSGREAPAKALERPAIAYSNILVPTHYCMSCGALWRFNRAADFMSDDDSWSMQSEKPCKECDMGDMDKVMAPLTFAKLVSTEMSEISCGKNGDYTLTA